MRIEFKKVTEKNIEDILKLKVKDNQKTFIESVPECLKEAAEKSCWRPVGIYDEDILIGFAMYCFWKEDQHVWMDRFLIASEFQGKGYGSAVFPQLLKKIESEYQCSEIYLSVFKDYTHVRRYRNRYKRRVICVHSVIFYSRSSHSDCISSILGMADI